LPEKYPTLRKLERWLDASEWENNEGQNKWNGPNKVHYVELEVFASLTDRYKEIVIFLFILACGLLPSGIMDPRTWEDWEYFGKRLDSYKEKERMKNESKSGSSTITTKR
jgi:hypothetical protein